MHVDLISFCNSVAILKSVRDRGYTVLTTVLYVCSCDVYLYVETEMVILKL
jgi:tRNA splicing endonuclease